MDILSEDFKNSEIYKFIKCNEHVIKRERDNEYKNIISGENYLNPYDMFVYNEIIGEINKLIKNENIYIYHCTKLTIEEIENLSELKILSISERYKNVIDTLIKECIIDDEKKHYFEFLGRKELDKFQMNRENKLWFVLDKNFIDQGCEDFFRYYGGEAIRRCLFNDEEKYLKYLERIGIPVIIKCYIPIMDIHVYNLEEELIDLIIGKTKCLRCSAYVNRTIKNNEIVEVIYV